jgi:hypothetical protein
MTKLLVTYGYDSNLNTVEIVNLDQAQPDLVCDNLPDLPRNKQGATGKIIKTSKTSKISETSNTRKTIKMNKTNKMTETREMSRTSWTSEAI